MVRFLRLFHLFLSQVYDSGKNLPIAIAGRPRRFQMLVLRVRRLLLARFALSCRLVLPIIRSFVTASRFPVGITVRIHLIRMIVHIALSAHVFPPLLRDSPLGSYRIQTQARGMAAHQSGQKLVQHLYVWASNPRFGRAFCFR